MILVGDLNSDADGSQTPTYGIITGAGYRDAWLDLLNAEPGLDQRLDLVLLGNGLKRRHESIVGGVHAAVVGNDPDVKTASGPWPADHAGVVVTLRLPGDAMASRP